VLSSIHSHAHSSKPGKCVPLCICVLWVSILFLSTIFQLDFGTVSTVWYFYAFAFISKLGEGFNYDSFLRLRSDKNIFQIYKHLLLLVTGGNLDDIQRMHRKGTVVLVGKAAIVKFVSVIFILNNYPNEKMY
jgi:hypothetical protein